MITPARAAVDGAVPAAGLRVALVGGVLGDVDVDARTGRGGRLGAGRERFVGHREGGVRAHMPRASGRLARNRVLGDAGRARSSPSRSVTS